MAKSLCPALPPPAAVPRERREEEPSPHVQAALRLLPPNARALTASMGPEDKEVLAFLIARPADEEDPLVLPADEEFGHPPAFTCRCFECYGSFWWRWQCSPVQRLIDQAMEAFDDHVAAAALASGPLSSRRAARLRRDLPEEGRSGGEVSDRIL